MKPLYCNKFYITRNVNADTTITFLHEWPEGDNPENLTLVKEEVTKIVLNGKDALMLSDLLSKLAKEMDSVSTELASNPNE